jgi:hypothetical protein
MLKPFMPDEFKVEYWPSFPRTDSSTFRWFQVIFAIGPGDDATARAEVHSLFERILIEISDISIVRHAEQVSLRARRRVPDSPLYREDHPFMFIESSWTGSVLACMRKQHDFSGWACSCSAYVNRFDLCDPLTRGHRTPTKQAQQVGAGQPPTRSEFE